MYQMTTLLSTFPYLVTYCQDCNLVTCQDRNIFTCVVFYCNSALEDAVPEEAIQLYTDACVILEEDGREQMAFDLYRAATSAYVKLEK